jgi:hypothetical protein
MPSLQHFEVPAGYPAMILNISIKSITYVFLLMWFSVAAAAQPAKPPTPQKAQQKAAPKAAQKKQAAQKKPPGPLRGRLEKLECKLGTEDRHARIAVELIGGRVKSLAYYSKWKPRTCSVHIVRDDAYSRWEDTGNVTVVTLNEEKGAFLIDYDRRSVKFLFREIDRERFCGMNGKITGSLTVTRGRSQCVLEGVMDENFEVPVVASPDSAVATPSAPAMAPTPAVVPVPEAVPPAPAAVPSTPAPNR